MKRKRGTLDFYETPVSVERGLIMRNHDNINHGASNTPAVGELWQYLRLVSIKNSAGQIESKYIFISPESNYKKKNEEGIKRMTFEKPLKDFTGRVVCYNIDKTFSKGWEYDRGVITAEIKAVAPRNLYTLQTRDVCYNVCTQWGQWGCSAQYGCVYTYLGETCYTTCRASTGSTTYQSDPFTLYYGGGSVQLPQGVPPALVGKCITPLQPLCISSLRLSENGNQGTIRMSEVYIGARDINGAVCALQLPYVTITTSLMPAGYLNPLIKFAIRDAFSQIVADLETQIQAKNITQATFVRTSKEFDLGDGTTGTMGDYLQRTFDGYYRVFIQSQLLGTGINGTYPATLIRSSSSGTYVYYPIVADNNCQ